MNKTTAENSIVSPNLNDIQKAASELTDRLIQAEEVIGEMRQKLFTLNQLITLYSIIQRHGEDEHIRSSGISKHQ